MKQFSPLSGRFLTLAIGLFICLPPLSRAGMAVPLEKPSSHWSSADQSGTEIWLISRSDGTMELHGKDLASTYSGIVLAEKTPDTWICHGTGFRFVGGLSFTYRSVFRLEKAEGGHSLVEEWTATLPNGEVISGKTVLTEVKAEEA